MGVFALLCPYNGTRILLGMSIICVASHRQGVNAPELQDNWFWQVGSVACRFYWLEASPMGSSLERFPMLSKKRGEVMGSRLTECVCNLPHKKEMLRWGVLSMSEFLY